MGEGGIVKERNVRIQVRWYLHQDVTASTLG